MTGKVKALALTLLAVAAIGAETASAAEVHIKDMGKVTATGTQTEAAIFKFPEGERKCPQAIFNFHTAYKVNAEGKQEDVETTASTFTIKEEEAATPLEPETIHCQFAGTFKSIIHMNGCDYALHVDTLQTTITCPPGKQITYTVVMFGVVKCTIHIPEQGDLKELEIKNNETKQDIVVTFKIKGIKYTTTEGEGAGRCIETLVGTDGQFTGVVTVEGKANGVASSIWYE